MNDPHLFITKQKLQIEIRILITTGEEAGNGAKEELKKKSYCWFLGQGLANYGP